MRERREFSAKVKVMAWERAGGNCERCTARLYPGKFRFNHRIPDALGGEPTVENAEVLCLNCDTPQTYGKDIPNIARAKRRERKHIGVRKTSKFACSRGSRFKKKVGSGEVVLRRP
jgi:5-methylcytosine-specific restriction protein A